MERITSIVRQSVKWRQVFSSSCMLPRPLFSQRLMRSMRDPSTGEIERESEENDSEISFPFSRSLANSSPVFSFFLVERRNHVEAKPRSEETRFVEIGSNSRNLPLFRYFHSDHEVYLSHNGTKVHTFGPEIQMFS